VKKKWVKLFSRIIVILLVFTMVAGLLLPLLR